MLEENGGSQRIESLKKKLEDKSYLNKAVRVISEQLVYFFYSEWKEES
jgi:hypothetical protein